jgi:hypothetical protein
VIERWTAADTTWRSLVERSVPDSPDGRTTVVPRRPLR